MKTLAIASACGTLDAPLVAAELARAVASTKRRVLFVDCDPQAHATTYLLGDRHGRPVLLRQLLLDGGDLASSLVHLSQTTVDATGKALQRVPIEVLPGGRSTILAEREIARIDAAALTSLLAPLARRMDTAVFQLDGFTSPMARVILREVACAGVLISADSHAPESARRTVKALDRSAFRGTAIAILTGTSHVASMETLRSSVENAAAGRLSLADSALGVPVGSRMPRHADPRSVAQIADIANEVAHFL
jgi:hypothetical protein